MPNEYWAVHTFITFKLIVQFGRAPFDNRVSFDPDWITLINKGVMYVCINI